MPKTEGDPLEDLFLADEEDGCNTGCGRCCSTFWCCHPMGIYIVPWFFFLIVGLALFVLFEFNLIPFCDPDSLDNAAKNVTACKDTLFLDVEVPNWGLFLAIITVASLLLGIVLSFVWLGVKGCAGRRSITYRYLEGCYSPVMYILWAIIFYLTYNVLLIDPAATTTNVIGDLAWFVFVVMIVYSIAHVGWVIASIFAVDKLNAKLIDLLSALKKKYKLLAKLFKIDTGDSKSGLGGLLKSKKKDDDADKDEEVVTLQNDPSDLVNMTHANLEALFAKIDTDSTGFITKSDLEKYTDASTAKHLWRLFDTDEEFLYQSEFENTLFNVQESARNTINEIKSRQFLAYIVQAIIKGIMLVVAVIIMLLIFGVGVADLLTAIGVIMMALGFTIGGAVNGIFANFIFLLTANSFGVGDTISVGSETFGVSKISLGFTYGNLADGRSIVVPNATVRSSRIYNYTRSKYTCLVLSPEFSAGTPMEKLEALKVLIHQYFVDNKKDFKADVVDHWFEIADVTGTKNTLKVSIKCFVRGANWSRFDVHMPIKTKLLMFVGEACAALGVGFHPGTAITRVIQATDDNGPTSNDPLDKGAFDDFLAAMKKGDKKDQKIVEKKDKKDKKDKGKKKEKK
eukprot:TRINITY_DN4022_c0_g1_i1.p1 TRINITY_DN4022_c0_g1~~TRINITY_DN4022_c0_g1_i1.p1  ORF type:complete len:626 (-),score=221.07 TRINITY_DN4022_c0_g1_i1:266-2143(-)